MMISFPAPKVSFAKAGEGRVTNFLPISRHFPVYPLSPFTPQNICSFWIHCYYSLPGSVMSLLMNTAEQGKKRGKAHCCHSDFFPYFEWYLQRPLVQVLFEVTLPFLHELHVLCSPMWWLRSVGSVISGVSG